MLNVGILLFNDVELLDFAGPFEVFTVASEMHGYQYFNVFTISSDGGMVRTVNGLRVQPDYPLDSHPAIDVLVIPGVSAHGSWLMTIQYWVGYGNAPVSQDNLFGLLGSLAAGEAGHTG
jgi:transcriptional regulator GlxA family with amidase domain